MLLLSIRPEFAQSILTGTKEVEFRRRAPRRVACGSQLVIYATSPTCALLGVATIADIIETTPVALWRRCRNVGGIDYQTFTEYYANAENAVGIVLTDARCFLNPPNLSDLREAWGRFQPPQQFAYLCKDHENKVRNLELTDGPAAIHRSEGSAFNKAHLRPADLSSS